MLHSRLGLDWADQLLSGVTGFLRAIAELYELGLDVILARPIGTARPPWDAVRPLRRGRPGQRNRRTYDAVIDQYEVDVNRRYSGNRNGRGETYCNIFVWDVSRAMGAEIPHWVNDLGDPVSARRGRELTANDSVSWLRSSGMRFGWREVSSAIAQELADLGQPVVAAWMNPAGAGHVAVVRPGRASECGSVVAQAGETNVAFIRVSKAFRTAWSNQTISYFAHD